MIQNGFASASAAIDQGDFTSPRRGSSFNALLDPETTLREGSLKRSRGNSESIFPSEDRKLPQRRDRESPQSRSTSIPPQHAAPVFEFSDDHKNTLRHCGISDTHIKRIELLQTIFFRSPHGNRFDPRSYLSKAEFKTICAKLNSEEARLLVLTLKSLYDKKIPLSGMSPNTIYTPAARLSCTYNSDEPKAKEISAILAGCKGFHVKPVNGYTFVEEETPETPEERAARRALKAQLFNTLEAQRGISDAGRLSELTYIDQIWSNYFKYMQLRVNAIDNQASPKIRCCEIEETFKEFLDSTYSSIKVGDCVVYFRKEDIDLNRTNTDKKTNLQLLSESLAPIGADGESMELHHLTRRHPGALVLMTQAFHQEHTTLLHLRSERHMRQPTHSVDRAIFASWKKLAFATILEALVPTFEEFDPAVRLFSETDLQLQDEETM